MKSATPYLVLMVIISMMVAIGQTRKLDKAQEVHMILQQDIQDATNEAYADCKVIIQGQARISRISGCLDTIKYLCLGTKNSFECEQKLQNICKQIGE